MKRVLALALLLLAGCGAPAIPAPERETHPVATPLPQEFRRVYCETLERSHNLCIFQHHTGACFVVYSASYKGGMAEAPREVCERRVAA